VILVLIDIVRWHGLFDLRKTPRKTMLRTEGNINKFTNKPYSFRPFNLCPSSDWGVRNGKTNLL
jgi:hypothetical protein